MPNQRLLTARRAKGLSQQALADAVGASKSHYSQIEEGRKRPSIALADQIASLLDEPMEALFGREALSLSEGLTPAPEKTASGA